MPMKLNKFSVGKRYAKALFEYSEEQARLDTTYQELMVIKQVLQASPDFLTVMSLASVSNAEQTQLLTTLAQPFSQITQDFLHLVFDYGRMNDLDLIIAEFERLYDATHGRVLIHAVSATALSQEQRQQIGQAYLQRFNGKSAQVTNTVDPDLIGGVIVEAEGRRIDGSIRTKLQQMRALLAQPLR
ncbi:ATP synthase F1 subunit delta [Lapidilactobacillus luobeiensis]|uniref:ATP synthase F1 subunit delta n=1 Tax=Lapidilactobacillus luobeiensis TaxID=2950371 RepID=UPI0021C2F0ED|nr:ATP synthase F1 subunit delta [Lapidilactobacillus luobeiensis]